MNICVAAEGYPAEGYPYYAFIENLCKEWARQGHNIYVIAPQSISKIIIKGRAKLPYFTQQKIGHAFINIYRPLYLTSFNLSDRFNYWMYSKIAAKILKRIYSKIDICYGHFWHVAYSLYPSAKKYNKPLFVASGEAEIEIHKKVPFNNLKPFVKEIAGVICVSSKNKNESINNRLTKEDKCLVCPNAIDNNLFKIGNRNTLRNHFGLTDKDFVIAYVGGFIQRKGPGRVAAAISKLNDPNIKSFFIGYPGNGVIEDPICNGILYKGPLPHDEIPKVLNSSDVFIMPTLHEGCCNSNIEALACGLPVISSDMDFNHDILNPNNSILIDPNNIDEIAEAIHKIKNNKQLRNKLSVGAHNSAQELTIDKRASKIIDFIIHKCK